MGAAYFRVPELALEKEEARALAEAIANVQKHYKIPGLREDHAAIAQLCVVLAITEGKRLPYLMAAKSKMPRPVVPQKEPLNVTPPEQEWFSAPPAGPLN
jgi:hypothetical protein